MGTVTPAQTVAEKADAKNILWVMMSFRIEKNNHGCKNVLPKLHFLRQFANKIIIRGRRKTAARRPNGEEMAGARVAVQCLGK